MSTIWTKLYSSIKKNFKLFWSYFEDSLKEIGWLKNYIQNEMNTVTQNLLADNELRTSSSPLHLRKHLSN